MKLIEPTVEFDKQIREYRQEFLDCGDPIDGASKLKQYDDPQDWIAFLNILKNPNTVPQDRVQLTQYMLVREEDQKIVGMINIRHYLNTHLEQYGGHIGISIVPSERHKGYASQMLKMALSKCRALGIDKVLYIFNSGNEGSKRLIQIFGGKKNLLFMILLGYSGARKPPVRRTGNRESGVKETASSVLCAKRLLRSNSYVQRRLKSILRPWMAQLPL